MLLDNRFQDWLVSIFDSIESRSGNTKLLVSMLGVAVTIGLWMFHLRHPFYLFSSHEAISTLVLVAVFAPPFVAVYGIAQLLFPQSPIPERVKPGTPFMNLHGNGAAKRWRIMITAGFVSALNLLFMVLLSVTRQ